jgi:MinD-like ATPase involved in chromosome partitioning or flagellar assembly
MLEGSALAQSNGITTDERFDFIGADSRLASINDVNSLEAFLKTLPNKYDVIFIDTPAQIDSRVAMAFKAADAIVIPTGASIHSLRGAINTAKIASRAKKLILQTGPFTAEQSALFSESEILDALIPHTSEIDSAVADKRSVLSVNKNSDFAEAYREASYSLLEHLKFF